jgi:S-adenosylmethionine hydrolase
MVIALLTDFGTSDHFVGAMKGAILSVNPNVTIVDITHEIEPQDVRSAAFSLAACYRDFPAGTIFEVVVDPGVGSDRRGIAASDGGYSFVGPDNGVFSFVLTEDAEIVELTKVDYFAERVSNTFHGRDIFAPVAAHLSTGVRLEDLGPAINDPVLFEFPKPQITPEGAMAAEVIYIDYFGNLVTNLTREDLPPGFSLEIRGRRTDKHCEYYAAAGDDEFFSMIGSTGFLEIAANLGSAKELLAAEIGDKISVLTK